MRVLLVEDEPRVAHFIARGLREESYAVDVAGDYEAALYKAGIDEYDLIVLDVMLPGIDGFGVCRELRRRGVNSPVLMLTARDDVNDRVEGLDAGADDYLTKPFAFKELLARLRALLRRRAILTPDILKIDDLSINTTSHTVTRSGHDIRLTAKEYSLLEYFAINSGKLVGRDEIARHVWDENFDPFSNVIDVYVRRLRKKIDEGFERPLIKTRRREGYVLAGGAEGERD